VIAHFLSYFLWLANSNPPLRKERFYAIKDTILRRWGTRDGDDWQQITHECWRCEGSGESPYDEDEPCERCDGSGIWDRFYVRLERWRLGSRIFHRPAGRVYKRPETITFVGPVQHRDVGFASEEAALWLALVFDRRYFRWLLTSGTYRGWYAYPLLNAQRVVYRAARSYSAIVEYWKHRTCSNCVGWYICRECRRSRHHDQSCAESEIE
jgi:hypothetical protein